MFRGSSIIYNKTACLSSIREFSISVLLVKPSANDITATTDKTMLVVYTPSIILMSTLLYTEFPSSINLAFNLIILTCYIAFVLNEHFNYYCQPTGPIPRGRSFTVIKATAALIFLMLHCTIQLLFSTVVLSLIY